jgi:hypothetical protein
MAPSAALMAALALSASASAAAAPQPITVTYAASVAKGPLDGRLLLLLSTDDKAEPRFQVSDTSLDSQQVFGIDVDDWKPGQAATFAKDVVGYPVASLGLVPPGTYNVQALLHRYETFKRADGHTLKLPMDRGEGQQWSRAPGNLYSTPRKLRVEPGGAPLQLALDQVIPEIKPPADTKYVKHERIRSERLSKFWGRDMYLGAHVLLPEGFDTHPQARYPLVINHGHFPADFGGFRPEPPDPDLKCDYSDRFHLDCYNRIQQEHAHQFFQDWTGPGFPRVLLVEIQHANPYYDDSYAVNSANLGPYGDAITYELIPYLEKKYRGLGAGWARFMYGGSTGGWEAMAAQVFYPDEFNGAWIACPDPIDFRAYTVVDIYKDTNAYWFEGPWKKVPRPGHRDYLGHLSSTLEQINRLEVVLGEKGRSGGQWDIWEAVYSPVGANGYPQRLWDRQTGVIDKTVAEKWKAYDLMEVVRRDWEKGLGEKLRGKLFIYVGDMDNYYLNNAVYLAEDFLKQTTNPPYEGVVAYGDRAEHCWNGDPTRANAYSRLRYHQMFIPRIVERIQKSAPAGADVTSWKY